MLIKITYTATMKIKRLVLVSVIVIFVLAILFGFRKKDKYFEILKNIELFTAVYKEISTHYVDDLNPLALMTVSIQSMLKTLDPYTSYIPEETIEKYQTSATGQRGRIGVTTVKYNTKLLIVDISQGGPAQKNGLQIGDEIVAVNNKRNLTNYTDRELSNLVQGEIGTTIDITIKRLNNPETTYSIKREHIREKTVPYYGKIDDEIGFIKLSAYNQDASRQVKSALLALRKEGIDKFILDLRSNPGGFLREAVLVTNLFIEKDLQVVSTKGRGEDTNSNYITPNIPLVPNSPLVILIDTNSASAAEITSGVIQDYDRGVIIGRRSFGKGLVQITKPLPYNAQIKITVSKYYIPSGRCIQEIDYSHLDVANHFVKNKVDSSIVYRTKNGRKVFSGQGIAPDVLITKKIYAPITQNIMYNFLFLEYVARYKAKHSDLKSIRDFKLSEQDYQDFVDLLSKKELDYKTTAEKGMEIFINQAKRYGYYKVVSAELKALNDKILRDKNTDLVKYKTEIKKLLEYYIVRSYHYNKGATEYLFDKDKDVLEAVRILKDTVKYNQILKR